MYGLLVNIKLVVIMLYYLVLIFAIYFNRLLVRLLYYIILAIIISYELFIIISFNFLF